MLVSEEDAALCAGGNAPSYQSTMKTASGSFATEEIALDSTPHSIESLKLRNYPVMNWE